ncbi:prepilin-type N-terminal cleavage/methylation domain-containing protein [Candidatus Gracilibacteria bacterium]|nr:MAG: prepilin-type N-terminal cleavage/methylation domain-containing protein [Candidatus Gracilibacteria bacterium]
MFLSFQKAGNKAFTLVELIIVVVILGILAAVTFVSYNSYSGKARDATRKADVKMISDLLQLTLSKGQKLPEPDELSGETVVDGLTFKEGKFGASKKATFNKELAKFPVDPSSGAEYGYSLSSDGKFYILSATMENGNTYKFSNFMDGAGSLASNNSNNQNGGAQGGGGTPQNGGEQSQGGGAGQQLNYTPAENFNYTVVGDNIQIDGFKPGKEVKDLIIPEVIEGKKITSVAKNAFKDNQLTTVKLPKVKTIKRGVFSGNRLIKVEIPEVETIENSAFAWNSTLTSITLPNTLKKIEDDAFAETGITEIIYNGNLTENDLKKAFGTKGWAKIKYFKGNCIKAGGCN